MQHSTFKIYNASAGSGKTFTLAKSYLKILVSSKNPQIFKQILAITFTNKAVSEMKERIINMLKLFASEQHLVEEHPMFTSICKELSISSEYLHNKSKQILKHIIHQYGAFEISTIDGFTHRVIRTFAYDLKLPVNFEVELDQDRLLNEAVESLIGKAGTETELTNTLVDFAIEKTDDDKSWDISYDFYKISKLLVNENDLSAINSLKDKTTKDFKELKLGLAREITKLEDILCDIATQALNLIEEHNIHFDDFNRKSLPKYFENLKNRKIEVIFEATWQDDLVNGNTLYPKRVSEIVAQEIQRIQPALSDAFINTKKIILELKLKKGFYINIVPLSVLNAIKKELNVLKEEQNKMLISEFNIIISEEIKNQPTPFIYERLGEKFKHYFIDEFQDTSKLQWNNLIPLLDNALSSSNGSVMLVGDAKQAIYRWRGGEAEQFIDLYNGHTNPFQIKPEVISLDVNYRSAKEIINFNNTFFEFLGTQYFSNTDYATLFKNANQNTHNTSKGYVNLHFLDAQKEDSSDELYAHKVLQTIKDCQANGYNLSDISVLVRKRKEGVLIANFLSDQGIKITSSETLLLKNSAKVIFITSFLKLLLNSNNDILKVDVLSFIAKQNDIKDKHQFFTTHLKKTCRETFQSLRTLNLYLNEDELLRLPLYELVEKIVRVFKLNNESDAFLQFYLDVVLEFTQKENSDLLSFLDYFEKKKDSLSVISPENTDAVQILTIHKSKGLEFPIVIFPFAELNIYAEVEPKIWFPIDDDTYQGYKTLLLNYNKNVELFGKTGKKIYDIHQSQLELDNINLLYVALTRAVKQLYVISKKDINSKGVLNEKTYAGMLISYLQSLGVWSDDQLTYSFGLLQKQEKESEIESVPIPLQLLSTSKEDHNLYLVTKSGLLWDTKQERAIERGNIVHFILSKIKTLHDVDFAVNELIASGDILNENLAELKSMVLNVVNHKEICGFFKEGFKIYNEHDIITKTGQKIRPDRLNINPLNEVTIIDYKTGEQKLSYANQLNHYEDVLKKMNLKVVHKFLVYINDGVEVVEV